MRLVNYDKVGQWERARLGWKVAALCIVAGGPSSVSGERVLFLDFRGVIGLRRRRLPRSIGRYFCTPRRRTGRGRLLPARAPEPRRHALHGRDDERPFRRPSVARRAARNYTNTAGVDPFSKEGLAGLRHELCAVHEKRGTAAATERPAHEGGRDARLAAAGREVEESTLQKALGVAARLALRARREAERGTRAEGEPVALAGGAALARAQRAHAVLYLLDESCLIWPQRAGAGRS